MKLNIAVLAGDGIGPEIMKQGVAVMQAIAEKFNHEFTYNEAICGAHAIDEVGDPFPEETFKTCMDADAVLFAAVGDPRFDNNPTAKVRPEQGLLAMRKKLGLFANVRPVATFDCLLHKSPLKDELLKGADFVVIRELTGGMYFGEKYQDNDKAYDTDVYTRPEIERILKVAFEFAMKRNKHLTVVDKANVLASSRLWRQIAKEMEPQYPEVNTDYMFIDNASMRVLTEPTFFDVIVTENTFGDILTDETSCITGSMGLQPSSSLGEHTPLFEPVHGSWPQAAGKNLANPVAQILSAAMLLEHFGLNEEGALIRKAVDASLDANVRTPEIQVEGGAQYGTTEVGAWIVNWIKNASNIPFEIELNDNVADERFIADGMTEFERNVKRAGDFLLAIFGLIVFSPLFAVCYFLVKREDNGPAIFKQERIGRFGKPFYIYKFRSMKVDAEKDGPQLFQHERETRMTRIGAFLRRHHLDELPQLWNVAKGDMAFIGPRPERKFYIDQIMVHDPRYRFLYQIRPGVTSYATLYNGYTDTMPKMLRRLSLDLYYLEHRSWWFDAKILFKTMTNIMFGKIF